MSKVAGFIDFSKVKAEQINDKIVRRMISGDQGMLVQWTMKKGAHGGAHKHPHEQIVWMISGRMDFRIGNEKRMMVAGDTAIIRGFPRRRPAALHEAVSVIPDAAKRRSGIQRGIRNLHLDSGSTSFARVPE
jgi:uncharacterized RmlC-like cupin family protein